MKTIILSVCGGALAYGAIKFVRDSAGMDSLGIVESSDATAENSKGETLARTLSGSAVLSRVNSIRKRNGLAAIRWGMELQEGLETFSNLVAPDMNVLMEHIQKTDVGAASVSVWHLIASSEGELHENVETWERLKDPDITHFAIHTKEVGRNTVCVAAVVKRVEPFSLAAFHREPADYVRECPICDNAHSVRFDDPNSTVVIACPHCEQEYDLIAFGSDGRYHRANDFLKGFSPPTAYQGEPTLALMISIWKTVLDHCRYRHDRFARAGVTDSGSNGLEDEIWRFGNETYRARSGDCEDTSILLADWLGSCGFDARVAVGVNRSVGSHAWCVVRLDGVQYLLETTNAEPDLKRPPVVEDYAAEYTPNQMFDRENLYFIKQPVAEVTGRDYWSEEIWNAVKYSDLELDAGSNKGAAEEDSMGSDHGWGGKG